MQQVCTEITFIFLNRTAFKNVFKWHFSWVWTGSMVSSSQKKYLAYLWIPSKPNDLIWSFFSSTCDLTDLAWKWCCTMKSKPLKSRIWILVHLVKKVIYWRLNDMHWLNLEGKGLSLKSFQTDLPLFWIAQKPRYFMNEKLYRH